MGKASRECLGVVLSVLFLILLVENKASGAVVHHDLKVELFPEKHELQGHDTITVEGESISSLTLHLTCVSRKPVTLGIAVTCRGGARAVECPRPGGDMRLRVSAKAVERLGARE